MRHFALSVCVTIIFILLGCLVTKPNRGMEALVCAAKDIRKLIKLR